MRSSDERDAGWRTVPLEVRGAAPPKVQPCSCSLRTTGSRHRERLWVISPTAANGRVPRILGSTQADDDLAAGGGHEGQQQGTGKRHCYEVSYEREHWYWSMR
jgi:hypothetical protein